MVKFVAVPQGLDVKKDNFFDYNPEVRYFDFVVKLENQLGDEGLLSRVMWALSMGWDPAGRFFRESDADKKDQLARNVVGVPTFDWAKIEYAITGYEEKCMSVEKRSYLAHVKLNQELISNPPKEAKEKILMLKAASSIAKSLEELKAIALNAEEEAQKSRGRQQPGAATRHKKRLLDRVKK